MEMGEVFSEILVGLGSFDWREIYYANPELFDSFLFFALFLCLVWLSLRRVFPGRSGRMLSVVLAAFFTVGTVFARERYGFSPKSFGGFAVLLICLVLLILLIRLIGFLRSAVQGLGLGSQAAGGAFAGGAAASEISSDYGILRNGLSSLLKRSEKGERSILDSLKTLKKDLVESPKDASTKNRLLERLTALMRTQVGLNRRLEAINRFVKALEHRDAATFTKWEASFQNFSPEEKKVAMRALKREWKRILTENKVAGIGRKLKAMGSRLEALLQRANELLRRNDVAGIRKVLDEAVVQAKTIQAFYLRIEKVENHLTRQTKKLLRQIRRRRLTQ